MFRTHPSTRALLAFLVAGLLWSIQAQAHAKLMKADPAPNAAVAAPKRIELRFSTDVAKKFSTFKLTDTDGNPIALTPIESQDAKTLAATPTAALTPGLYTVSWTAVSSDDGHKTNGTYSFTVQ